MHHVYWILFHFHSACENTFCVASHIFCEWGKLQYYRLFHYCKFCPRPFFKYIMLSDSKALRNFIFWSPRKVSNRLRSFLILNGNGRISCLLGHGKHMVWDSFGSRRNINLIIIDDICSVFYLLSILCAQLTCTLGPNTLHPLHPLLTMPIVWSLDTLVLYATGEGGWLITQNLSIQDFMNSGQCKCANILSNRKKEPATIGGGQSVSCREN